MQFNSQIALAILGFVSMAAAQHEHGHAHAHRKRQTVQEFSDGKVGWSAPPGVHGPRPTAQSVSAASAAQSSSQQSFPVAQTPSPATPAVATPPRQTHGTPSAATSVALTSKATSGAEATTLTTATSKHAKSTASASGPEQTTGDYTINIVNKYGSPLSLAYGNNAGGPGAKGNPKDGMLSTSTQVVYPTGWAGRITIGKDGNGAGSKIEGSYTGAPDVDVSYVDGYSVPMVCSCGNDPTPVTGCNIELFDTGLQCPKMQGKTCINTISATSPDGPTMEFFKPCEAAAYTYPTDDLANTGCTSHVMNCCIGTSCAKVPRQPGMAGLSGNSSS